MIENKNKIFGLSPHNKGGDVFEDSDEGEKIRKILDRDMGHFLKAMYLMKELGINPFSSTAQSQ